MADYFNNINAHVQGEINVDYRIINNDKYNGQFIVSIGSDDIITMRNIDTNQEKNLQLPPDNGFNCIALNPKTGKVIVGGISKNIMEMDISQSQSQSNIIYQTLGNVYDLKYSDSGRYLSIASQQQKCIIMQSSTNKKYKCRPGHSSKILNTYFSPSDQFVATIGQDMMCLIYALQDDKDPQQTFRHKISNSALPLNLSGCFHYSQNNKKVFIPGNCQLIEGLFLNSHWQTKKSKIAHASPIICCQSVSNDILVTSCTHDICIWDVKAMEKLVVLQQFPLMKIVKMKQSFMGIRNDGIIYVYNRKLPTISNAQNMEIQQKQQDKIVFQVQDRPYNEPLDLNDGQSDRQMQIKYISSKKTKADKVIQVFPQIQLTYETSFYDNKRFLFINPHGCIVQNRQAQSEILVQAQFHSHQNTENIHTKTIFRNRELSYFDMNSQAILYSSTSEFGIYIDQFSSWQKSWNDICNVALSAHWLAIANQSQIRIYDMAGNHIKSIGFNRHIVAFVAYQNLLAVVYHQSIPMWNRQMLSMEIFSVSQISSSSVTSAHVPITEGSILRWFGFSNQGMIFSQDSDGFFRAYSLETNEWTSLFAVNMPESKRMSVIGIKNYQVLYWKTTDEDPQPTVRPRLNLKSSKFAIATLQQFTEQMINYSYYLWQRYCLDHELARWRIWGKNKQSRVPNSKNYHLSKNILSEKEIRNKHTELDNKFCNIVIHLLKSSHDQSGIRALNLAKSQVRSVQSGKFLIDQFDNVSRNLAIELEQFYDQKARQLEYQAMLQLDLKKMRAQAERTIQPKKNNPMNPKNKRTFKEPVPFSFSQSSVQSSICMEDITQKQQHNNKVQQEMQIENPFLKKNPTSANNSRNKQIEEQVQKFGIKKKAKRLV